MSKYKVYTTDFHYDNCLQEKMVLSNADIEFTILQCKTADDVVMQARDADALLVQYVKITDKVFKNLENLKVAVRYGVGYDVFDLESAEENGVITCNVPDYGIEEVSTHAMALILASVRKIVLLSNDVKSGNWDFKISQPIYRTNGRTLGIVGLGRIGKRVAQKAEQFGYKVQAYDPFLDYEVFEKYGVDRVDFDTLLKTSDVISIHAPLKEDTFHMFNKEAILKIKSGAYLVNTARGPIVDQESLVYALEKNLIAGAALDVCENEPLEEYSELLRHNNLIITPHAAWYSEEAQRDLQRKAAEEVVRVLSGKNPLNPVNKPKFTK